MMIGLELAASALWEVGVTSRVLRPSSSSAWTGSPWSTFKPNRDVDGSLNIPLNAPNAVGCAPE